MRLRALVDAVAGVPPDPGAPKQVRLRWLRRMYYRYWLPILIVVAVIGLLTGMGGVWLVPIAVAGALWLCGFALVNLQIAHERRSS